MKAARNLVTREYRPNGRIPHKLRSFALRSMSGRAWATVEKDASPERIAAALSVDVTNYRRRRSGQSGAFAGTVEEVYALETKGISTFALTAHMKSVAMQARLKDLATEDLVARLAELQERETEANGLLDMKQMKYALGHPTCLQAFRDRAAAQAAVSEELTALLDELMARQTETG